MENYYKAIYFTYDITINKHLQYRSYTSCLQWNTF